MKPFQPKNDTISLKKVQKPAKKAQKSTKKRFSALKSAGSTALDVFCDVIVAVLDDL